MELTAVPLPVVVALVVITFVCGVLLGHLWGTRLAHVDVFDKALSVSTVILAGHPSWRRLTPAEAVLKFGVMFGGDDTVRGPKSQDRPAVSNATVAAPVDDMRVSA